MVDIELGVKNSGKTYELVTPNSVIPYSEFDSRKKDELVLGLFETIYVDLLFINSYLYTTHDLIKLCREVVWIYK